MRALNKYRTMWLMVMFDLPTEDARARRAYGLFRKGLLKNGFNMMQFSVYTRHCASRENADVHAKRVQSLLPGEGMVSVLTITDKQFGAIKNFWGRKRRKPQPAPNQLELF
ncbi:CRISPR-associated endonuclease Cas2 [bacterium]|nr:CRISPR-associated endonuclease Cas2 [bacterium]